MVDQREMKTNKMVVVNKSRNVMNKKRIAPNKKNNPLIRILMMKISKYQKLKILIMLTTKKAKLQVKLTVIKFDQEENVVVVDEVLDLQIVIATIIILNNSISINNIGNQLLKVPKVVIVRSLTLMKKKNKTIIIVKVEQEMSVEVGTIIGENVARVL